MDRLLGGHSFSQAISLLHAYTPSRTALAAVDSEPVFNKKVHAVSLPQITTVSDSDSVLSGCLPIPCFGGVASLIPGRHQWPQVTCRLFWHLAISASADFVGFIQAE